MKIKTTIKKLEEIRTSLMLSIKDAEKEQKKEAFINLLYSDYDKVVYGLNLLYGLESGK